jgi:hypothetical protein
MVVTEIEAEYAVNSVMGAPKVAYEPALEISGLIAWEV